MVYIGIDPGKSGAMAIINRTATGVDVRLVPFDEQEYKNVARIASDVAVGCVVERVTAMPKQGVTSMFNFGVNFGFIQGLLTAYGIPFELVSPAKWKREFGVTSDKNTSIAVAQRLFPDVSLLRTERCKKPDDGIAEALLMAEYARRRMGGANA